MLVTTRAAGPRSFCTSSVASASSACGGALGDLRVRARSPAGRSRSGDVIGGRLDERARPAAGATRRARRRERRRSAPGPRARRGGAAAGVGTAVPLVGAGGAARRPSPGSRRSWWPRRACSPRRSPTTRGRPRSCPSGTARTARPRATRSHRKRHASSQDPPSGSRWDRPLPLRFVTASLLVRLLLLLMTTLRPASAPTCLRTAVSGRIRSGLHLVGTRGSTRGNVRSSRGPQDEVVGTPSRSWLCTARCRPGARALR